MMTDKDETMRRCNLARESDRGNPFIDKRGTIPYEQDIQKKLMKTNTQDSQPQLAYQAASPSHDGPCSSASDASAPIPASDLREWYRSSTSFFKTAEEILSLLLLFRMPEVTSS